MRDILESFFDIAVYLGAPNTTIEQWRPLWDVIATKIVDEGVLAKSEDALTLATQGEAEAGTNNTAYMSPLRVAQALAALVGAIPIETNTQTDTAYELVLTDAGLVVELTNASAITLTVPTNTNAAFPVGTLVGLRQGGVGTVTVTGDVGVTVNSLGGLLDLSGQYATATLEKTATNTWILYGALA